MEIAGLPLHPLVVHAAVTLIPLAAVLAIVFAVVPKWRWLSRWPTLLTALAAVVVAWVARLSGHSLYDERYGDPRTLALTTPQFQERIETHLERGDLLSLLVIPFAILVVAACWSLAGQTALASGKGSQESRLPALEKVLPALLVLAALGIIVLTILTGDAGSRAHWG